MESSKLEFWTWLRPKPGASYFAMESSKLEFWRWVQTKVLERVTLPSNLKGLSFGYRFNQNLE